MKIRKLVSFLTALTMAVGMVGASALAEEPAGLLDELTGTYDELFTVVCAPEYDDLWLKHCTEYAGEENARAAADMLKSACVGTIYGQEAVDTYAANPDSTQFDCFFTQNVKQFVFNGNQISGLDDQGKEVFSHTYAYVETVPDVIACYVYKTEDADAGEFTYFLLASDTPASTYHIEFRYGSDLDALKEMYTGDYAYWLAAGISADRDDAMLDNAINLFCSENLTAEEEPAA